MTHPIGRRALLAGAATAAALSVTTRAQAAGQVVVGTWGGDYAALLASNIDKPIMAPMGIEVIQDIGTQDPRKTKLTAERNSRRGTMDVACLSDIDTYTMSLLGVWEPLTPANVPNLVHVPTPIQTGYSVPQIISGKVMLYLPDRIAAPKGYLDLWDPKHKGRVGLIDIQYLYVIMLANLAHGGPMNDFTAGKKALLELKKLEPKIYPSNEAFAAALKGGEVDLGPMWLARQVFWKNSGINVNAAIPSEGAIAYISSAAVPKNAQNKANGLAYLNAMLDPRSQLGFARSMSYAPTIDDATIPADLMAQIAFTPEQQAALKYPDFDYLAKNTASLLDFWNKEFKA